jgi:hypothetical protein
MINNFYFLSLLTSITFLIVKLIHYKYIIKEKIVFKKIFVDTFIVFCSSLSGLYIIDNINNNTDNSINVDVNNPEF